LFIVKHFSTCLRDKLTINSNSKTLILQMKSNQSGKNLI